MHRFGVGQIRGRLRQLPLGLIKRRLEWPRVDLKKQLALLDERALLVTLPSAGSPVTCALTSAFTNPSSVPIHSP